MRTADQWLNGYKRLIDSYYLVTENDFKEAINLARKETAISILEWSAKRGWESYVDEDRWICISQSNEVIDTEQLYERFIHEHQIQ